MKKKQYAQVNDNRLMEAAFYHETKGMTVPIKDGDNLYKRFREFKIYVMRGEFTIEQLEDRVWSDYGIQPDPNHPIGDFLDALYRLASKDINKENVGEDKQDIEEEEDETQE